MKLNFLIVIFSVLMTTFTGQAQDYLKDIVGCIGTYGFAGHCLIKNAPNSIDYGIHGIPKKNLELFTLNSELIIEKDKLPLITPKGHLIETIGLKNISTGDTLFQQSFFVVSNLRECKSKMDSISINKSCSKIFNFTIMNFLIYGEPNKIILNVKALDLEKIHVKMTNGEILEFGEGFIMVLPKSGKFSELIFEFNGEIISKSIFIINK